MNIHRKCTVEYVCLSITNDRRISRFYSSSFGELCGHHLPRIRCCRLHFKSVVIEMPDFLASVFGFRFESRFSMTHRRIIQIFSDRDSEHSHYDAIRSVTIWLPSNDHPLSFVKPDNTSLKIVSYRMIILSEKTFVI